MSVWRWLIRDRWVVVRCGWPYPEGYCAHNPHRKTSIDHGLSREDAEESCKELNS